MNSRAATINSLKDAMGQAVSTINAADKSSTAITALIEQAKGIAQQALSAGTGTGHATETVTLNAVELGDTITINGTTLTAGPTAVVTSTAYNSFTITAAGVDNNDTVTVGGVTFTAVATTAATTTYDSVDVDFAKHCIRRRNYNRRRNLYGYHRYSDYNIP